MTTRIAVLQMTAGIDPAVNAATLTDAVRDAAAGSAAMLFTPEMSGLIDRDRVRATKAIVGEQADAVLRAVTAAAATHGVWVALGSLAVRDGDLFANRSFVIDSTGSIVARYDKIHLFDVDLGTERWTESAAYRAGDRAVTCPTPAGMLGLSVCYDVRFPALYQSLAGSGATILAVPWAFTVPTGHAHWHTLLKARSIENAAFVVAAAQTGSHHDGRTTFGHSLVVGPWGDVLLDLGTDTGLGFADIDQDAVDDVRARMPVLSHRRTFADPIDRPRAAP